MLLPLLFLAWLYLPILQMASLLQEAALDLLPTLRLGWGSPPTCPYGTSYFPSCQTYHLASERWVCFSFLRTEFCVKLAHQYGQVWAVFAQPQTQYLDESRFLKNMCSMRVDNFLVVSLFFSRLPLPLEQSFFRFLIIRPHVLWSYLFWIHSLIPASYSDSTWKSYWTEWRSPNTCCPNIQPWQSCFLPAHSCLSLPLPSHPFLANIH